MARPAHRGWIDRLRALRHLVRLLARSKTSSAGELTLGCPAGSWYEANSGELVKIARRTVRDLERKLWLSLPRGSHCYLTDPDTATAIQGLTGAAYRDFVIMAFPQGQLSSYAGVLAHELAHLMAGRLGRNQPPFLAEGFACFAAWWIHASKMPCGMPLHYHPAWLLWRGVRPRLDELWNRADYTPELYDLAWSFAAFLFRRYGRDKYYAVYAANAPRLADRLQQTLGESTASVERQWHEHVTSRIRIDARHLRHWRREAGVLCSRAAWLKVR